MSFTVVSPVFALLRADASSILFISGLLLLQGAEEECCASLNRALHKYVLCLHTECISGHIYIISYASTRIMPVTHAAVLYSIQKT